MASPLTVWSTTADGVCYGDNADYATARSTGQTVSSSASSGTSIGQRWINPNYRCYEAFLDFDTSSVGSGSTVTTATLSLYCSADLTTTDFTAQARIFDWSSGGLTVDDFRSGNPSDTGSLDEYTLLATKSTSPTWSTSAYTSLTSESAFLTNVVKTGTTGIVLNSDRHLSGDTPSGDEAVQTYFAEDNTGTGGTDRDPKLYVEWTEGGNTQMTASSSFAFAGDAVSPSWSTTNWHGVTVYRDVS